MLKIRIIPTLLYKNFGLVKGVGFDSWRRVGSALQAIMVYSLRGVDELLFLDISATSERRPPDFEIVDDLADECFMPLTVGGGVRSVEDVHRLLMVGADKVAINSAAVETPGLITAVANRFGAQCLVVSIDFKKRAGGYEVYTHAGSKPTGIEVVDFSRRVEALGAGEILLTSIERDGTMTGFELECIRQVCDAVTIPVIASGGAGNARHLLEAVTEGHAAAVAAASIFHFTEQTPQEVKHFLYGHGIPVRL
ncbi:MAG: imidazole glycerol phosphate synthase cyclase subunit [Proteobacteria bacterium]|nr:imidazole glycerol phosphate synthase subunit HisF [Desulfobulbaceae bacterium]MBU4153757.1 imidazole glycerol phosphate synthase cyclase subunit [Pseudomonadota bacterium]